MFLHFLDIIHIACAWFIFLLIFIIKSSLWIIWVLFRLNINYFGLVGNILRLRMTHKRLNVRLLEMLCLAHYRYTSIFKSAKLSALLLCLGLNVISRNINNLSISCLTGITTFCSWEYNLILKIQCHFFFI
jgi:hypothetical protein